MSRRAVSREIGGDEEGFTLIELVVVMIILGIVLVGLTSVLTSAMRSEKTQANRVKAQQDGRLGLDKLRRELHCASGATTISATSVTLTIPGYCTRTYLIGAVSLPADTTLTVGTTMGFGAGAHTVTFSSSTQATTLSCTGTTATTFTGCSGGKAGTYPAGAAVTNTTAISATWCAVATAPATIPPSYELKRGVGACSAGSGTTWAKGLVSDSLFTLPVVPIATATPAASGGTLGIGTYSYVVTAVLSNGREAPGTLVQSTFAAGSANKITLNWSAYTPPTGLTVSSYNVYGRDSSVGIRLLRNTATLSYADTGPTALRGTLTLPNATIPVDDTSNFNTGGANTISFQASGNVTCAGTTPTPTASFTGCTGGAAGSYASGIPVSSASSARPPAALLTVNVLLDATPADTQERLSLNDYIVLRNSRPF
jgi:prepilin-type N-terminal cleavage/methylation domain-containing protein